MTDANVVLGHLPPRLLGGEMELDVEAARAAVQTIADAMGLDSVEEAAEGILAIVNENMAGALRLVSVQRGHDPREFALVAYGGAGPLHANAVAEIMGSFPVLVPPAPGLLCAIGDLVADFRDEFAQTYIRVLGEADAGEVGAILEALGARATAWLDGEGIPEDARTSPTRPTCATTGRATRSPWRSTPTRSRGGLDGARGALQRAPRAALRLPHAGHRLRDRQPAGDRLGRRPEARAARRRRRATPMRPARSPTSTRSSSTASALPTKIYDRAKLAPGNRFDGPAIVTEFDSTTVVLPGYAAEVDANFNILINPKA